MANETLDKAVYIRETTDGKTRWVKIPGIKIQNGYNVVRVYLDKREYKNISKEQFNSLLYPYDDAFERRGRAE